MFSDKVKTADKTNREIKDLHAMIGLFAGDNNFLSHVLKR